MPSLRSAQHPLSFGQLELEVQVSTHESLPLASAKQRAVAVQQEPAQGARPSAHAEPASLPQTQAPYSLPEARQVCEPAAPLAQVHASVAPGVQGEVGGEFEAHAEASVTSAKSAMTSLMCSNLLRFRRVAARNRCRTDLSGLKITSIGGVSNTIDCGLKESRRPMLCG